MPQPLKTARTQSDWRIVIDEAIDALSSSPNTKRYFTDTLASLAERKERYTKGRLLVGLIGATSSGKSKVVNALLNEELLPVRVRPSSGVGVWCSLGDERQAIIRFVDGKEIVLRSNDLTQEQLQRYADEEFNLQNFRRVQSIDITSPAFAFPRGITIIDTPGLDADGFEYHEEITLRFLLPLLDVCVIVLTAKPYSDEAFQRHIAQSLKLDKETIVLQNMIDAVEPEYLLGGRVRKDLDSVKGEHRERILKSLLKMKIQPDSLHIVQASARERLAAAMNNNIKSVDHSGIQELIDIINQTNISNDARRNDRRLLSLRDYLENALDNEHGRMNDFKGKYGKRKKLASLYRGVGERIGKIQGDLESIDRFVAEIDEVYRSVRRKAIELNEGDIAEGGSLWRSFLRKLVNIQSSVVDNMERVDKVLPSVLLTLCLDPDDFHCARPKVLTSPEKSRDFSCVKVSTRTINKRGVFATLERGFGRLIGKPYGTETVKVHTSVLRIDELLEGLETQGTRFRRHLLDGAEAWRRYKDLALDAATRELNRLRMGIEENQQEQRDIETLGLALSRMKRLLSSINIAPASRNIRRVVTVYPAPSKAPLPFAVSPATLLLISKAGQILAHEFRTITKDWQTDNYSHIIIWGWNRIELTTFAERFLGDLNLDRNEESSTTGLIKRQLDGKTIILVDETKTSLETFLSSKVSPPEKKTILFCLLPMEQYGLGVKLFRSGAHSILGYIRAATFVPVIESIHSAYLGGALREVSEVFMDFLDELEEYQIAVTRALVNHPSPLFSRLLLARMSMPRTLTEKDLRVMKRVADDSKYLSATPHMIASVRDFTSGLSSQRA